MTRGAHLGILLDQTRRVESRPVRIEVTPAQRRMAGKAVALNVTADTRLETLPRRAAMTRVEELAGIVVAVP